MTTTIRRNLKKSDLKELIKDGIQALETGDRKYISEDLRAIFDDSINTDEAFKAKYSQSNRWDYLIGNKQKNKIIALEPHTAKNSEIGVVIAKRSAARQQLKDHLDLSQISHWFWVASGKTEFLPLEKANMRLNENGIEFIGKALLRKHLK